MDEIAELLEKYLKLEVRIEQSRMGIVDRLLAGLDDPEDKRAYFDGLMSSSDFLSRMKKCLDLDLGSKAKTKRPRVKVRIEQSRKGIVDCLMAGLDGSEDKRAFFEGLMASPDFLSRMKEYLRLEAKIDQPRIRIAEHLLRGLKESKNPHALSEGLMVLPPFISHMRVRNTNPKYDTFVEKQKKFLGEEGVQSPLVSNALLFELLWGDEEGLCVVERNPDLFTTGEKKKLKDSEDRRNKNKCPKFYCPEEVSLYVSGDREENSARRHIFDTWNKKPESFETWFYSQLCFQQYGAYRKHVTDENDIDWANLKWIDSKLDERCKHAIKELGNADKAKKAKTVLNILPAGTKFTLEGDQIYIHSGIESLQSPAGNEEESGDDKDLELADVVVREHGRFGREPVDVPGESNTFMDYEREREGDIRAEFLGRSLDYSRLKLIADRMVSSDERSIVDFYSYINEGHEISDAEALFAVKGDNQRKRIRNWCTYYTFDVISVSHVDVRPRPPEEEEEEEEEEHYYLEPNSRERRRQCFLRGLLSGLAGVAATEKKSAFYDRKRAFYSIVDVRLEDMLLQPYVNQELRLFVADIVSGWDGRDIAPSDFSGSLRDEPLNLPTRAIISACIGAGNNNDKYQRDLYQESREAIFNLLEANEHWCLGVGA